MTHSVRQFLPALLAPLLVCVVAWFVSPPILAPDTAHGLRAWEGFLDDAGWNHISHPDPDDISQDIAYPLTWWSPGQYLPVGLLSLAGLPTGDAMMLVALLVVGREYAVAPASDYMTLPPEAEIAAPRAVMHHYHYVDTAKRGYYRHAWHRLA